MFRAIMAGIDPIVLECQWKQRLQAAVDVDDQRDGSGLDAKSEIVPHLRDR
jgi:hypothetical protein